MRIRVRIRELWDTYRVRVRHLGSRTQPATSRLFPRRYCCSHGSLLARADGSARMLTAARSKGRGKVMAACVGNSDARCGRGHSWTRR